MKVKLSIKRRNGKDVGGTQEAHLIAENKKEEVVLDFIAMLNKHGGFVPLMDMFVDLINAGVLENYDGALKWNNDWGRTQIDDPMFR